MTTDEGPREAGSAPDATGTSDSAPSASPSPGTEGHGDAGGPRDDSGRPIPAAVAGQPSRRSTILRSLIIVAVLVVVFGLILPQFVDYKEILASFQALTAGQIVVMTLLGLLAWVASGAVFSALIPGLSLIRGTMSWLILSGTGSSIPAGPWNMGIVWVVIRGWGMSNAATATGVALYGVADTLARMAMPLLVIVPLILAGEFERAGNLRTVGIIALIGVAGFFILGGAIVAIVRSERLAEAVGRYSQRAVGWVVRRLGRSEQPDVASSVMRFRDQMGAVIRTRGFLAITVAIVSKVAWTIVLLAALRAVGVPASAITPLEVLAVYSLTFLITIIPIAPGGAGVPELLMISMFSSITGGQYSTEISAGVFLFRIYQWFLPIPLAWILLKVARRGKPMLPTGAELRAVASGATAGEAA